MGQKNGIRITFGYNSAGSEPIWMKSGTVWTKCWGLALADFWRDPNSSVSLRGSRIFCRVNNARFRRFHVRKILRHFNTTSIGEAVKTFGTEFWKFLNKGSFFQKTQKFSKFLGLATLGSRNSAMITDRRKFTSKWSLYEISSFKFYR